MWGALFFLDGPHHSISNAKDAALYVLFRIPAVVLLVCATVFLVRPSRVTAIVLALGVGIWFLWGWFALHVQHYGA